MPRAVFNGEVLADSNDTIIVEGNHYFPPGSIRSEFFKASKRQTVCHWKGVASYYDVHVDGKKNKGAAWYYPEPSEAASKIKDYVAFYRGKVDIER